MKFDYSQRIAFAKRTLALFYAILDGAPPELRHMWNARCRKHQSLFDQAIDSVQILDIYTSVCKGPAPGLAQWPTLCVFLAQGETPEGAYRLLFPGCDYVIPAAKPFCAWKYEDFCSEMEKPLIKGAQEYLETLAQLEIGKALELQQTRAGEK